MTSLRHFGTDSNQSRKDSPFNEARRRYTYRPVTRIIRGPTLPLLLMLSTLISTALLDAQQGSIPPKPPPDFAAIGQAILKPEDLIGKWKVAWIGSYFNQAYSATMSVTSPTALNRQADMEFVSDGRLMILKKPAELALWKWDSEGTQEFSITHAGGYVEHCWAIRLTKGSILLSQMRSFIADERENTEIMLLLLYQESEKNYAVP